MTVSLWPAASIRLHSFMPKGLCQRQSWELLAPLSVQCAYCVQESLSLLPPLFLFLSLSLSPFLNLFLPLSLSISLFPSSETAAVSLFL